MRLTWCILLGLLALTIAEDDSDRCDRNWHTLETEQTARLNCGPAFKGKCLCSKICYENKHQYVVNCTNSGFTDVEPLEHLPNMTEVLIFTGNDLYKLPWNIFGTLDNIPSLTVIDMSNNKIREISGKAYHHVQNVQRLSLDFNELSIQSSSDHPRVFSNFVSLLELHLTDAFEDGHPSNLAETLHNIFVNSNLSHLIKLHLEQNEIKEFKDPKVFCDLPNLLDLHLGDNYLTALHFNLSCLDKLRFLDLQRNNFTRVLDRDLKTLDNLVKNKPLNHLTIDLLHNPFECGCKLNPFIKWMKKTKVFVRNREHYRCRDKADNSTWDLRETKSCLTRLGSASGTPGTVAAIVILSLVLVALVCALIYVQREDLKKKLGPVIESVNKRVRYTSIATAENRENEA